MNDPRGSVWRKWDLQVQPIKHEWFLDLEGNRESIGRSAKEYLEAAKKKDVRVIAITDHNSGIGIDPILGTDEKVTVLPGIELDTPEGWHLLVLFNEDYKDKIQAKNWEETVKQFLLNICELSSPFHDTKGVAKQIEIRTEDLLRRVCSEEIGFPIFAHCCASDGFFRRGGKKVRKKILELFDKEKIHFAFEIKDNFKQVDEIRKKVKNISDKNLPIPILSSSDAHQAKDVGTCFTWIKADPTYEGVKKVAIEPHLRCQINSKPEKLSNVEVNKTKFIDFVSISKVPKANESEIWFKNIKSIPLNFDLVSVIGNKGTGKSAFTDIAALSGKTRNYKHFSFLNTKKFRHPRRNKSKSFEAFLNWRDGNSDVPINLNDDPDSTEPEKVKYLPQNFLEELCNPEAFDEKHLFEKELKEVIFSWVPDTERLGKSTLDEIIDYQSEIVQEKVESFRTEISRLNKKYLEIVRKLHPDWKKEVNKKHQSKKNELDSHIKNKPEKVSKPKAKLEEDSKLKKIHEKLTKCSRKIDRLTTDTAKYNRVLGRVNDRIASGERIIEKIYLIQKNVEDAKKSIDKDLKLLDIKFEDIFEFKIKKEELENKLDKLRSLRSSLNEYKSSSNKFSLKERLNELKEEKQKLESKLDEPNKKYQKYLAQKEKWEEQKEKIVGEESKLDTLKYFETELGKIKDVYPAERDRIVDERLDIITQIHTEYDELKKLYKRLYKPVSDFISTHEQLTKDFNLSFDVTIESKSFKDDFLEMIHSGKKGSFYGDIDGYEFLSTIHDSSNFNDVESLKDFLKEIDNSLLTNRESNENLKIEDQLKKNTKAQTLYDYLYGLNYLEPAYQLKLDNKELYELSPGERGTLLLIFYLLIDRSDLPLIIDQPEENLDNETVYRVLVYCIREAKKRRQIIIVTHNPNLAVVCDSEQIIVADIDKKNGNEVSYMTGSIENPEINQKIIDILEGTRPAFNNRGAKYFSN